MTAPKQKSAATIPVAPVQVHVTEQQPPQSDVITHNVIIRLPVVKQITGLSRSSIYKKISEGTLSRAKSRWACVRVGSFSRKFMIGSISKSKPVAALQPKRWRNEQSIF